MDDDISLNLARVRVYLAAGETAHGDDHVCSESNLYFPVWCLVFFVQKKKKCLVPVLVFYHYNSLSVVMVHIHAYFITQKGLVFLTAIGANYVFVKTVLCAHTRYYFKTHELGGPVMALVHVNLA